MPAHRNAVIGIVPLHGTVQDYGWGARDTLARLLDRPASGGPEAEYWLGAHPASPSLAQLGRSRVPLDRLITKDPARTLGPSRTSDVLPFLLKVLAVDQPLSLQVHPSREQAQTGFAREEHAGVPIDAGDRSYRDRNHKPEVLLALEPMTAMSGIRPCEQVRASLAALTAAATPGKLPRSLADLGLPAPSESSMDPTRWAELLASAFRDVFSLSANAGAKLQRVLCESHPVDDPTCALLHRLAGAFPSDPTVVAALLLNQITLQPREALFNGAGTLHAYVSGTGVELMANSDNVLRAGLTTKHIDAYELLAIADLQPSAPQTIVAETAPGSLESVYRTPALEFQLSVIDLAQVPAAGAEIASGAGPEILLLLGAKSQLQLRWHGGDLQLSRGSAAFVPAAVDAYRVAGAGDLYRARLPD